MLPEKHPSQEDIICDERTRQARWAFNLAFGFATVCSGITVFGCILFLIGQTSKGAYIGAGGLSSTTVGCCCMRLSRDANDRLDRLPLYRQPNDDVECPENSVAEDSKKELSEDTDSDALTEALKKIEQAILEETK